MPQHTSERAREIEAFFVEQGFGNVELLEGWDGEQLEDLRDLLSEEEFETLLDRFGADEAHSGA